MMNNEQQTTPVNSLADSFQARVQPWMMACFGAEISADGAERNHRFLEESLELVQACGCTASEAHQLVDYAYGRPVGERAQEVGGVMVTLAALCLAQGLDMHAAGETELARIWTKVEAICAKQAAKPKHSPLPVALPRVLADGPTTSSPPQPIFGQLMDQISALPVLWGLNEPGALLRNSDVFRVLAAAGREQATLAAAPQVVADERAAFEAWAKAEGLIQESFGIRSTNSMCDVALKAWAAGRAALAAAPVQAKEPLADIWTCTRMHDMGTVKDAKGEFIAQSYFKDMKALTDRHNASYRTPVQPVAVPDDLALIKHERDTLAQAIADAALKAGIWNGEAPLSGPHLIVMVDEMAEVLSAPSVSVPDGWKMVPAWPTQGMSDAGSAAMAKGPAPMKKVYRSMLAAAPAAPAAQGDTITLTRDELVDHRNQAFEQGVCEGKDQAAQDDAKDAERWRTARLFVGADRSPALGNAYFVLRGIYAAPGVDLMRGSAAGHFTDSIDAAIAAKAAS